MRVDRRNNAVTRFRKARLASGHTACDACGWAAPERLRDSQGELVLLQAHHVIPIVSGGPDVEANLSLLCRNCHALAHELGDGRYYNGRWTGAFQTPDDLVRGLKHQWRPIGTLPLPIPLPDAISDLNEMELTPCPE